MISLTVPAFSYLIGSRRLTEETIQTFDLAYCSPNGTVVGSEKVFPKMPATFNHSSLFPIADLYGTIVGVSCRPLTINPTGPKYINTVYDKKQHLYGLSVTWAECLRERAVYVVEGNVDTLQMWQAGIKNVVGMLGSTFSYTQLCLLSRFVKKIILVADNDKAGNNLLKKLRDNVIPRDFYDADVEFKYVLLPAGLDPDNYLKQFSKQDFLNLPQQDLV